MASIDFGSRFGRWRSALPVARVGDPDRGLDRSDERAVRLQPVASNLSAEAAAIGGLPVLPLLNNGLYKDTAAGDFAVTLNLPPLDQPHVWLISDDLSINGQHVLGGQDVFGPISVTGAVDEALGRVSPFVQRVIEAQVNLLLTQPQHNGLGLVDWSYNSDPADNMTGTFALGSTLDVPDLVIGRSLIPGEFMFSLSASAFAVDVPEPAPLLIFVPALLGRWRCGGGRRTASETSSELAPGPIFFSAKWRATPETAAGPEQDLPVPRGLNAGSFL
jgi:hypothetical protein